MGLVSPPAHVWSRPFFGRPGGPRLFVPLLVLSFTPGSFLPGLFQFPRAPLKKGSADIFRGRARFEERIEDKTTEEIVNRVHRLRLEQL